MNNPFAYIGMAVAGLFGLTLLFGSWYTVDQGERVVVTRNGAVVDEAGPGLHFKTPWIESITAFEVRTQKLPEPEIAVYSSDIQPATVSMSINYHLSADKVREIYATLGETYTDRIITPNVLRTTKEIFGKYAAGDIINHRDKLGTDILVEISKVLTPYGITVDTVQIENIDFSDAFEKSVEQRMQAEIEVKKREQELRTTEIEAQQALAKAQGVANATKAQADGEAYRVQVTAKAQAEAIKIQGESLRTNPLFVELTKANRWDGKLPTTMLPNGATPLLDLRQIRADNN